MREPDFIIGKDSPGGAYLKRWWVIPRNRWFNIYLHQILRDDDDRALHDHPWWNVSLILRGGYFECTPGPDHDRPCRRWRGAGSVTFRRARSAHRLEVHKRPAWTLFITGPRLREWGFYCPKGWVLWKDFVSPDDHGSVGPGCRTTKE